MARGPDILALVHHLKLHEYPVWSGNWIRHVETEVRLEEGWTAVPDGIMGPRTPYPGTLRAAILSRAGRAWFGGALFLLRALGTVHFPALAVWFPLFHWCVDLILAGVAHFQAPSVTPNTSR